jgi:hypothetical protein
MRRIKVGGCENAQEVRVPYSATKDIRPNLQHRHEVTQPSLNLREEGRILSEYHLWSGQVAVMHHEAILCCAMATTA